MAKAEKELLDLKEKVEKQNKVLQELTDEELEQVCGGRISLQSKSEERGGDGSYVYGVHANLSSLKDGN